MGSKKYYKEIGLIRILSCIAVLLYHMNILKGGYLAVCTFFVLSGYLSCISCFKKEKFSFKEYYKNKLLHIYLPLLFVAFISIAIIHFIPNINWFNLKPETTSVLLGYNNFWQLSANLDYFARHVNSPFMHLWYIAIILQFDLVFPFIYLLLRKIGDKVKKCMPHLISLLLALISLVFFYKSSINDNIMVTYYNTLSRVFSLLFGVSLGFIHSYYKPVIPKFLSGKYISKIIFYTYLIIMIISFVFIESTSPYFAFAMILVTLITTRLLDYGIICSNDKLSIVDKFIKSISSISYEIYLVQYPIIFLFQYINITPSLKTILIIILTIIISYILHYSLNFKKKKILRKIISLLVISFALFGFYQYVVAKDYTDEMKELELKLLENVKIMETRQKEYADSLKKQEEEWNKTLEDLENFEENLKNMVNNLPVVGIGDSVMLGAIDKLYETFPNGYIDAKTSRTAWVLNGILKDLQARGLLSDNIIINLGANGDCPDSIKEEIMNTVDGRKVFWLNTTNYKDVNQNLNNFASKYDNLYIVDWYTTTYNHPEYFIADGIHLTSIGIDVFTNTIYEAIYNVYLEEYQKKKDEIINKYQEEQNNKISFFGNDILLNAYDYLKEEFSSVEFVINSSFEFSNIKEELEKRINEDTLTKRILLAFDSKSYLTKENYQELINICNGHDIYIVDMTNSLNHLNNNENVKIVNFYEQITLNENYLMPDKIHLTNEGNIAFCNILKSNIN